MRLVAVTLALGLALAPSGVSAQPSQSLEELARRVHPGNRISVEDEAGVQTDGRLAAITADEIAVATRDGERRFPRDAVAAVHVRRSYGRIGVLVGAAVGAALCIPCTSGEHGDPDAPVLTGLLGAGIGGIAGALIPRMRTEYRAPGRPAAFALEARFAPRGTGVRVVLRW